MHDNRNEATVDLHSLLAWLAYLTWKGISSRFAHQMSHQEHRCFEDLRRRFFTFIASYLCRILSVCLSACTARCQTSKSTCSTILQATERGGGSEDHSNSVSLADCRGLGTNPAMGQLPELLPAVLMTHQAFQQLQLQLLPFQVCGQQ